MSLALSVWHQSISQDHIIYRRLVQERGEDVHQFRLLRALVSPSVLKINSRTFRYKAGRRELTCSLAVTSLCAESHGFFCVIWDIRIVLSKKCHKLD